MSQPSWQPAASAVDQDADEWLFPINGAYEGVLWTGLQVSERLEAKLLASAVDGKAALGIATELGQTMEAPRALQHAAK